MNLPYLLSEDAKEDLISIYLYGYDIWGEAQADRYHDELHRTFAMLSDTPRSGRLRRELAESVRSFAYQAHIIFYMEWEQSVAIVRVLHGAKDFPADFKTYNADNGC